MWEVIIYEENGVWNWKANEKDSVCNIPVFGKTFDSEIKTKEDFERYAESVGIEKYEYVTEENKEK